MCTWTIKIGIWSTLDNRGICPSQGTNQSGHTKPPTLLMQPKNSAKLLMQQLTSLLSSAWSKASWSLSQKNKTSSAIWVGQKIPVCWAKHSLPRKIYYYPNQKHLPMLVTRIDPTSQGTGHQLRGVFFARGKITPWQIRGQPYQGQYNYQKIGHFECATFSSLPIFHTSPKWLTQQRKCTWQAFPLQSYHTTWRCCHCTTPPIGHSGLQQTSCHSLLCVSSMRWQHCSMPWQRCHKHRSCTWVIRNHFLVSISSNHFSVANNTLDLCLIQLALDTTSGALLLSTPLNAKLD